MTKKNELAVFDELQKSVTELVAPISGLTVTTFPEADIAIQTVKQVKDFLKRVESTRTSLVAPLNQRVKEINAYAKGIESPLIAAERHVKTQLVAFEMQQEQIRAAARAKAEAEERRVQAELKAKQEAEIRELNAKQEADREIAGLFGVDEAEVVATQEAEIDALIEKSEIEQAVARLDAKVAQEDIAEIGIRNTRKVWKCEVVNLDLVPREYLIVSLNEKAVLAMARGGVTQIPGIKLWQETQIAVSTHTRVPRGNLIQ